MSSICLSVSLLTRFNKSGFLPKKCFLMYPPPSTIYFSKSPSTISSHLFRSEPFISFSNKESQSEPQMHFITFQPAPLNAASSSCIIFEFPLTGPSSLCRLQFTTNIRLSKFSLEAKVRAPFDSGSSISPSPKNANTFLPVSSINPLSIM